MQQWVMPFQHTLDLHFISLSPCPIYFFNESVKVYKVELLLESLAVMESTSTLLNNQSTNQFNLAMVQDGDRDDSMEIMEWL